MEVLDRTSPTTMDRGVMAIHIQYIFLFFMVTYCRETHELSCDGFNDLFTDAIDLAKRYIYSAPSIVESSQKRTFALEPGVIPTIYLVGTKCRHPPTRRRAISLLREGGLVEAMWDSEGVASVLQRSCEVEEMRAMQSSLSKRNKDSGLPNQESQDLDIDECARFAEITVANEIGAPGVGTLLCARYRHERDGQIELSEYKLDIPGDRKPEQGICSCHEAEANQNQ